MDDTLQQLIYGVVREADPDRARFVLRAQIEDVASQMGRHLQSTLWAGPLPASRAQQEYLAAQLQEIVRRLLLAEFGGAE